MFRKPRRVRLITPETIRLSRPDPQPARPKPSYGGLLIDSAEGLRWSHASTSLPTAEVQPIQEPAKVEGARMAASVAVSSQVEIPLAPLPEPNIEPTE